MERQPVHISPRRNRFLLALTAVLSGCGSDETIGYPADAGVDPDEKGDGSSYADSLTPQEAQFLCKTEEDCTGKAYLTGKSSDCVTAICATVQDGMGICKFDDVQDGTSCDDNNKCTSDEVCELGVCTDGTKVECVWDNDPCHKNYCEPKTGNCNEPATAGASCDDETQCTFGGKCDGDGVCKPGIMVEDKCDDGNLCTQDYCEIGVGCTSTPVEDGMICLPQDVCHTDSSRCEDGECVEAGKVGCSDDGNLCNGGEICDPDQGGCVSTEAPSNGTICENSNPCVLEAMCVDGSCVPQLGKSCDDGDDCTLDSCNSTGDCSHVYTGEHKQCDDGDPCTSYSMCQDGKCTPISWVCDYPGEEE